MKSILILILTMLLLISHTACNGNTDTPSNTAEQTAATTQAETVETTSPPETVLQTEEPVTTTVAPEDPTEFPYEITDIDELRTWAGEKFSAETAAAFLTGDTDVLFKYDSDEFDEKTLNAVKSIKISDFRFVFENEEAFKDSKALFEFTVTESECVTFPPGEYSYTFRQGPVNTWINNDSKEIEIPDKYKFPANIVNWISPYCSSMKNGVCHAEDDRKWFDYGFFMTIWQAERMLGNESYTMNKQQMGEYAKALYGVDGYVPPDHVGITYPDDDNIISLAGRGADVVFGEIVEIRETENGVIFVKQMYAEKLRIVPSHRIEYIFERNTSRYGWTLKEIVCVERSKYEPGGYAV